MIILCEDTRWAICFQADFRHEWFIFLNLAMEVNFYFKGGLLTSILQGFTFKVIFILHIL